MAATVSLGRLLARSICPSSLPVWSQMPWRSLQKSVALRLFARTSSNIRRIAKICDVVG